MKIFLTGASSGIGKAAAEALLARGDEVWGTSRDVSRIAESSRLHAVRLDLADHASIGESFTNALQSAGRFDVVINNAGSGQFGPAELLHPGEIERVFQTLVFAQLELCRLAIAAMQQNGGLIINVTSLAAELPVPYMAAYNAAKAAMASFTMTMQLELGRSNIRLIDLQPGDICTEFNEAVQKSGEEDERVRRTWEVVDRNMENAPKPQLVGERIAQLVAAGNPPPRVIVGDFFQSKIAPLIFRLLPQRTRVWGLRRYYGI